MIDIGLYKKQIEEAVEFLKEKISTPPEIIIVLGTGLNALAQTLDDQHVISYLDIPNFPVSAVASHEGNLIFGKSSDINVAILQGRVHYYEGYSAREVGLPMRVLSLLGAHTAIITNASGGVNPAFAAGSIMILNDHINLLGDNPLRGPNIDEWGPRFPDLSQPYNKELIQVAQKAAEKLDLERIEVGTYVCIPGPSLETPAETRFLRASGADAVGMSSVPETIVAIHAGMKVLGLSVVANVNDPDKMEPILLDDIIQSAAETEPKLQKLISEIIARY